MDEPFIAYGKYVILAAGLFFFFALFEARMPSKKEDGRMIAVYPVFARLSCAAFIVFSVLFALALSSIDRESVGSRILIFALIGVPVLILSFEMFGKRIAFEGDCISRSYFGVMVGHRSSAMVIRVADDTVWAMFRIYFKDGSSLWISKVMRGSSELAVILDQKKNGA